MISKEDEYEAMAVILARLDEEGSKLDASQTRVLKMALESYMCSPEVRPPGAPYPGSADFVEQIRAWKRAKLPTFYLCNAERCYTNN